MADDEPSHEVSLRQLRHHTKNALQRVLCQIAACAGLQQDAAGRALATDLERRIHLSAAISDQLFGMTRAPRSFDTRLDQLCRSIVDLLTDGDQEVSVETAVWGRLPRAYEDVIIRVVHELVGNAVKHGMTLRMIGKIEVTVAAIDGVVTVTVADDGWGFCPESAHAGTKVSGPGATAGGARGDGLRIAQLLANEHGGTVTLHRDHDRTHAVLVMPAEPRR